MKSGLLRNLEDIQEEESKPRGSRSGTLLLASLCGACVLFAVASQVRRKAPAVSHAPDPLGELLAQTKGQLSADPDSGESRCDLSFDALGRSRTTTALAAVRAPSAAAAAAAASAAAQGLPAPGATAEGSPVRLPPLPTGCRSFRSRPRTSLRHPQW